MLRETPVMKVRKNIGELLSDVQYKQDQVIITKAGKPVAALIDMPSFERLRQMDKEYEQITLQLQQSFNEIQETEVNELLEEAIHAHRNISCYSS